MTIKNTVCEAISRRRVLKFDYNGMPRVVEPYAFGVSSKGNDSLRAFFTSGHSSSGQYNTWKLYSSSKMTNVSISEEHFDGDREGYVKGDSMLDPIYCEI